MSNADKYHFYTLVLLLKTSNTWTATRIFFVNLIIIRTFYIRQISLTIIGTNRFDPNDQKRIGINRWGLYRGTAKQR